MQTVVYSPFYPKKCKRVLRLKNSVVWGIGSNEGASGAVLERLWRWLSNNRMFSSLHSSPLYINPPFGYTAQNDFYNATLVFTTRWSLNQLLGLLFYLERRFGRKRQRAFKNAPRTLDIDMIFYNRVVYKQAHLNLPHPQWDKRPSVTLPLFLQALVWRQA
ncbi:2-amino-4-hydroxy-6-hydroxymethyldihydropteridine pyrophosphokinase FolK [Helicobacter sp. NHP19-003]|uniref:2-amino-4-hydroxy-6-hydroxymethyldihydropteridine pyrophosphokinase n=1 Tax=Helicobacter gastrocanis TaxID=2849641 RepID=A0ABN6I417_9HELI|nr:2-amino-4-hydroxy-6-hydroxymethyldihydropteridine diphosphokinase [Helicobacter sp. NHP19-003]BCZ18285.1 2-amino-4-hydroxy-6-hydroxymethyldihydropteridine pyrophosphokinase FolK [Helicobacter sp. NHP19-003]